MPRLLLLATGGFFVLYGATFALFPEVMAAFVTGASPATPSGVIDLRATYGGMSVAIGIVILILALQTGLQSLGLLSTAIVLLAMAAGRVVGMVLDGSPNLLMYVYLAAEVVVGIFALYLRNQAGMVRKD